LNVRVFLIFLLIKNAAIVTGGKIYMTGKAGKNSGATM